MSEVYANAPYPDIDWGSVQQVYWSGFPVLQPDTAYSGEFTTSQEKLCASQIFLPPSDSSVPTISLVFSTLGYNRNAFGGILAFLEDVDDEGNIAVFANREDIVLPTEIGGSVSGQLEQVPISQEQDPYYEPVS